MKTFNFLSGQIKALLETKHHMQLPNDILQFILSELSTSMAPVMLKWSRLGISALQSGLKVMIAMVSNHFDKLRN